MHNICPTQLHICLHPSSIYFCLPNTQHPSPNTSASSTSNTSVLKRSVYPIHNVCLQIDLSPSRSYARMNQICRPNHISFPNPPKMREIALWPSTNMSIAIIWGRTRVSTGVGQESPRFSIAFATPIYIFFEIGCLLPKIWHLTKFCILFFEIWHSIFPFLVRSQVFESCPILDLWWETSDLKKNEEW